MVAARSESAGNMAAQLMARQMYPVSERGLCAQESGETCAGSVFGQCCSQFGYWYVQSAMMVGSLEYSYLGFSCNRGFPWKEIRKFS